MKTVSSQRYTDDSIVESKRQDRDYIVHVTPVFVFGGIEMRVITDGHHSLLAARLDGAEPEFVEQDASENDNIALIERGELEVFFEATRIDSDWYDIETGHDIW